VLEHGAQAGGAERDVVERAGAFLRLLGSAAKILLLDVARLLRARADVHDVDAVDVHPVHRKAEVGMRSRRHA
jgi:hypothetical protein